MVPLFHNGVVLPRTKKECGIEFRSVYHVSQGIIDIDAHRGDSSGACVRTRGGYVANWGGQGAAAYRTRHGHVSRCRARECHDEAHEGGVELHYKFSKPEMGTKLAG